MMKLVSKFAMDIFPSVIATILGAYIVNHYINTKPEAPAAAVAASVEAKKAGSRVMRNRPTSPISPSRASARRVPPKRKRLRRSRPTSPRSRRKPLASPPSARWIPAVISRSRVKSPSPKRRPPPSRWSPRRIPPRPSKPRSPPKSVVTPTIWRVRRSNASVARPTPHPRAQEAARQPDPPRVATAAVAPVSTQLPAVSAQPVAPLPPPIMVSTPPAEMPGSGQRPPYSASARVDDPRRPTPPADIPDPRPLDLRADAAADPAPPAPHTTVADDMLSAAKSVFHAVLPNNSAK